MSSQPLPLPDLPHVVKMEVSRYSHPFYTGKQKLLDTAGRVDKFRNRYAKFTK